MIRRSSVHIQRVNRSAYDQEQKIIACKKAIALSVNQNKLNSSSFVRIQRVKQVTDNEESITEKSTEEKTISSSFNQFSSSGTTTSRETFKSSIKVYFKQNITINS